jgi:allantoin racemase
MRIMFLNHSFKRHSPELEAHIMKLLASYASPETIFELAYPEDLGGGAVLSLLEERKALSGLHHILETPALVQKAIEAERLGFDAVMQSNTFDPGVEASRLAVRIPVIGLLRASLHFTASICDRFGLIVPLETHMPHTMRLVQTYGMSAFVCGIRTVGLYDTGELSGYHDIIVERTVAAARELVQQGAQAIIPLGGKIYPYVVTPEELEPRIGVPVVNTKAVGVSYAELMVRSKISHSEKAYPWSAGLNPEAVSQRSK